VRSSLAESESVYLGKVDSLSILQNEGARVQVASFVVLKGWKNALEATNKVLKSTVTSCSYPFEEGEEYLVYAFLDSDNPSNLIATTCSTKHRSKSDYEIEMLERIRDEDI
jgi:hypothetical protein